MPPAGKRTGHLPPRAPPRGCQAAQHLTASAAQLCPPSPAPTTPTQAAAARLHLRRPPRPLPPPLPQPGPAFESRREPGELRRWTGATPHSRLLLPSPSSPLPVPAGGVSGAGHPADLAALAQVRPQRRAAYIGAHPNRARAASGRRRLLLPEPRPGSRGPPPGGRLHQAQLLREVGRERARSPRDCADCGAPGGPAEYGRARRPQSRQRARPC